ncbi:TetR/AcrR family transcriptional regulator [Actinokineospora sp.]|uniref:TetR/AcrR family transcriptional regulator n=1 Tax=Actinokineospora sp. TaxID=1872133 RepID=UPI003D6BE558
MSRREQYREDTRRDAKRIAMAQLAVAGPAGVSLNAIAKEMGLTGPALYRYFTGRDALLGELIADGYTELAKTVERTAELAARRTPKARLREMADAFREWALDEPQRYLLLFGSPVPAFRAPEHTVDLAQRTLTAFAEVLAEIPEESSHPALERQFALWIRQRGTGLPPAAMKRAVIGWTRMHGVLSLEVEGHFDIMGFDPALLFHAEVDALTG